MKKFDLHVHSAPISCCARLSPEELAVKYHKCGYDGIMLTNHYSQAYIEHTPATLQEWKEGYLKAYHDVKREFAKYGMEVFFGAEVTIFAPYSQKMRERYSEEFLKANYADLILFGLTEEYFLKAPFLCDLSLAEVKAECNAHGVSVTQAHPFRHEQLHSPRDPKLLDGIEVNGNVQFSTTCEKEVLKIADDNDLFVFAGGDTHFDWHKLKTATYIPDDVTDSQQLNDYLKKVRRPKYSINETDDFSPDKPKDF